MSSHLALPAVDKIYKGRSRTISLDLASVAASWSVLWPSQRDNLAIHHGANRASVPATETESQRRPQVLQATPCNSSIIGNVNPIYYFSRFVLLPLSQTRAARWCNTRQAPVTYTCSFWRPCK